MKEKIEIINYTEDNKSYIKDLNFEWLTKHFYIEPNDELQLNDPQKEIIDKGGHIFYIKCNGEIVGTATLIHAAPREFELSKMAITERFQGKGIANFLMKHCIDVARSFKACNSSYILTKS